MLPFFISSPFNVYSLCFSHYMFYIPFVKSSVLYKCISIKKTYKVTHIFLQNVSIIYPFLENMLFAFSPIMLILADFYLI